MNFYGCRSYDLAAVDVSNGWKDGSGMGYFPVFVEMGDSVCVVVGGGRVAARKAAALLEYGALVRMVAPEIGERAEELKEVYGERMEMVRREYESKDLEGAFLVVAAADGGLCNRRVAADCRELGVLVNVADRKEECGFLFPATVYREPVSIGITTSGVSPAVAGRLRRKVEELVTDEVIQMVKEAGAYREALKQREIEGERRGLCNQAYVQEQIERIEEWKTDKEKE